MSIVVCAVVDAQEGTDVTFERTETTTAMSVPTTADTTTATFEEPDRDAVLELEDDRLETAHLPFPSLVVHRETWYVVQTTQQVQLLQVGKERGTHGHIYVLWHSVAPGPCWVGQSVPALVAIINWRGILTCAQNLHASSVYRILRLESRKRVHKQYAIERYDRGNLALINAKLQAFTSVIYVTKNPDQWNCTIPSSVYDRKDSSSPPRDDLGPADDNS